MKKVMKKLTSLSLSLLILLNGWCDLFTVAAEDEMKVTMVADFESTDSRACFQNGQYNFFQPNFTESTDVCASGDVALNVAFGTLGANLHQFVYSPPQTMDLRDTEYIMFYLCNNATLPLAFTFSPQTFIITEGNLELTDNEDFWRPYIGQRYQSVHDWGVYPAQVYNKTTGTWEVASRQAVGTGNGADNPGFTLPAGFEGFVRVPLSPATERIISYGLNFTVNAGSQTEDGTYPVYSEYNGASFMIDDILLLGNAGACTLSEYIAETQTPKGLIGVAPTSVDGTDGKITGVTTDMEYKLAESDGGFVACEATEITGLTAGTYHVRYKGTTRSSMVVVPAFVPEDTIFLNDMFRDNMVIQRNTPIVINGTCTEGDKVTVAFSEAEETVDVENGAWSITLPAMVANAEPQTMKISNGSQTKEIKNVLIGDVWLCSGQSNMDWKIGSLAGTYLEPYQTIKNNSQVRYFLVPRVRNQTPQEHFDGEVSWSVPNATEMLNYSAYAFSFASCVQEATGIPIGVVDASYGGSSIQHWMSEAALKAAGTSYNESFYNAMIHPMDGFAIKGILWYQGESNIQQSVSYTRLFEAYANDYRKIFGNDNLPIITTQLPRYSDSNNSYPKWSQFRLEQWRIAEDMDNVEIVCGIDLGTPNTNIHPSDKFKFGVRASQLTLNKVYEQDVPGTSAYPKEVCATDNGWKILFDNAESGLEILDGEVRELYLIKANGDKVKATAQVTDTMCLLVNKTVEDVVEIQYCVSAVPEGNLYTENGLPVAPFALKLRNVSTKISADDMFKKEIPDRTVVLTFDDALKNHYTKVAPVLKARGFDATFYVTELSGAYYGANGYADGVEKGIFMTWDEIADLAKQGFEIGNHSMIHTTMPLLSEQDMRAQVDELADKCEQYGIATPVTFAYPGLFYSPDIMNYLTNQGYTFARTGSAETYNPLKQHPLLVMGTDASLEYNSFVEQVNKAVDGEIVVLLYHDVSDKEAFARTMDYLKDNDFTVLSMKDLEEYIDPEIAATYFEQNPFASLPEPEYSSGKNTFAYPEDFTLDTQGHEGFYYMYAKENKLYSMNQRETQWGATGSNDQFCLIGNGNMHPGNSANPVLCWVAPKDGVVQVSASIKVDVNSFDGVRLTAYTDNKTLRQITAITDTTKTLSVTTLTVKAGERLYFELDRIDNDGYDTTNATVDIAYYGDYPQTILQETDGWKIGFGTGLSIKGGETMKLELICEDGTTVETQGTVSGNSLVVDGKELTGIKGIQYIFAEQSDATLYTADNLPVAPFSFVFKAAPEDLTATATTGTTKTDGSIIGVTVEMEYRKDGETTYQACTGNVISGLATGRYYVRYKVEDGALGIDSVVIVPAQSVEQSHAVDYTDAVTGVKINADKGVFEADTVFDVTEITSGDDYDKVAESLSDVGKKFKLYKVVFADGEGKSVTPNGTIKLSIPIQKGCDADALSVYYINTDGTKTLVNGTVIDGYFTVVTRNAGVYALVETSGNETDNGNDNQGIENGNNGNNTNTDVNSPQTGNAFNIGLWFVLIMASLSVMFVTLKFGFKRKKVTR
ncbi:MAG: polysaccharide deacetylase family protein [Tyzzerella sp.]|nr:polysaccharide deacetylase family protein [Tyzzerella sp.]